MQEVTCVPLPPLVTVLGGEALVCFGFFFTQLFGKSEPLKVVIEGAAFNLSSRKV